MYYCGFLLRDLAVTLLVIKEDEGGQLVIYTDVQHTP
jgi:hypothetical protein